MKKNVYLYSILSQHFCHALIENQVHKQCELYKILQMKKVKAVEDMEQHPE